MRKLTKAQKEKYNKSPNKCPYCGSEDLEGRRPQTDSSCAWQEVTCLSCGQNWHDVYQFVGIEETDLGKIYHGPKNTLS